MTDATDSKRTNEYTRMVVTVTPESHEASQQLELSLLIALYPHTVEEGRSRLISTLAAARETSKKSSSDFIYMTANLIFESALLTVMNVQALSEKLPFNATRVNDVAEFTTSVFGTSEGVPAAVTIVLHWVIELLSACSSEVSALTWFNEQEEMVLFAMVDFWNSLTFWEN